MPSAAPLRSFFTAVVLFVAAAGIVAARPSVARACGGFFSRKVIEGPRRPSLSYERTLIVFDQEKRREHFVREVTFRAAREPFGFVVPLPARPEVASLKSPFDGLEREYPFETLALGGSRGGGLGGPSKSRAVTVLEVKRVGSFVSFVLAADDEHALAGWLDKNGFSTTPESDRWLAHYVRMKFFFVAMRYEPPAGKRRAPERASSETVRISFDTQVAYYPYYEPDPPPGLTRDGPRMLELWLVSQTRAVPVATKSSDGKVRWVRPMAAGSQFDTTAGAPLAAAFGDAFKLLPRGPVFIQTFIDQKRSRVGYGDVLFVPDSPSTPNVETMKKLFPILDPTLLPTATTEPAP